jgi:hypothetical protein
MMALVLVSRSFKVLTALPGSWHTVDISRVPIDAITSFFKLFPLSLRSAIRVTIGAQFWSVPKPGQTQPGGVSSWTDLARHLCVVAAVPTSEATSLWSQSTVKLLATHHPAQKVAIRTTDVPVSTNADADADVGTNAASDRDLKLLQPNTRLSKLHITQLDADASSSFVRLCPNLTDLCISGAFGWRVNQLQRVIRELPHLRHMTFIGSFLYECSGVVPPFVIPAHLETFVCEATRRFMYDTSSKTFRHEILLEGSVTMPSRLQKLHLITSKYFIYCTEATTASFANASHLYDVHFGAALDDPKRLHDILMLPAVRHLTLNNMSLSNPHDWRPLSISDTVKRLNILGGMVSLSLPLYATQNHPPSLSLSLSCCAALPKRNTLTMCAAHKSKVYLSLVCVLQCNISKTSPPFFTRAITYLT